MSHNTTYFFNDMVMTFDVFYYIFYQRRFPCLLMSTLNFYKKYQHIFANFDAKRAALGSRNQQKSLLLLCPRIQFDCTLLCWHQRWSCKFFLVRKSKIRKFLGSFCKRNSKSFWGVPVRKSQIRKFSWFPVRKSEIHKFARKKAVFLIQVRIGLP